MTFKLANKYVLAVGEMLAIVPMKAGRSRHRQRIIKQFNVYLKSYTAEVDALLSEIALLDDEGKLIADENGQAKFASEDAKQQYLDSFDELNEEFMYLESEQNMVSLKKIYHALEETEMEFAGTQAVAYDVLMEALEDCLEV